MIITSEAARDFLVNYQYLNSDSGLEGSEGVKTFMQRVRCIQYDPLNVVGRNADLVLQSRIKNYKPEILQDLLYKERYLIDGVDKVMSIILQEDYPKMERIRKSAVEDLINTLRYRDSLDALEILDEVKEYIRVNGPLPADKINIGGSAKQGRWGHKKLSSAALDYLYNDGQLGISTKIKTRKVYDLNENLLPKKILMFGDAFHDEKDFLKWYIKRRVGSIGLVNNKNDGAWIGQFIRNRELRTEILRELTEEGELIELQIEDAKETYYIRKEELGLLKKCETNAKKSAGSKTKTQKPAAHFIAPLDNLIWDRGMLEDIFHFKYTWEVYVPAAKRKYGYYVLPVLYGNRFVARFEPEKNNGKEPFRIKNWWWEPDVEVTDDMKEAVREACVRFGKYLGTETAEGKV